MEKEEHTNYFDTVPDEIVFNIFKWLSQNSLLHCDVVCKQFYRCTRVNQMWSQLKFKNVNIKSGALEHILKRGVKSLSLESVDCVSPVFKGCFLYEQPDYESKLRILLLRKVNISKSGLVLLLAQCPNLKELHLERISISDDVCTQISTYTDLKSLTIINCNGLDGRGIRKMLSYLQELNHLNITSSKLSILDVTTLVQHVTSNILNLTIGGCRRTLYDRHLKVLAKRCPRLIELNLLDCCKITAEILSMINSFKQLKGLSLYKCNAIGESVYIRLSAARVRVFGPISARALNILKRTFAYVYYNEYNFNWPIVKQRRASI